MAGSDSEKIDNMVLEHYRTLRAHPRYRRCVIRVYIEANMSWLCADRIARTLLTTPGLMGGAIEVVRYDPKNGERFGTWTTNTSKERWKNDLRRSIGTLQFATPVDFIGQSQTLEQHREALCQQMLEFRRVVKFSSDKPEQRMEISPRITYTGKSVGKKDDRVSSLCIAMINMFVDCFERRDLRTRMQKRGMTPLCAITCSAGA